MLLPFDRNLSISIVMDENMYFTVIWGMFATVFQRQSHYLIRWFPGFDPRLGGLLLFQHIEEFGRIHIRSGNLGVESQQRLEIRRSDHVLSLNLLVDLSPLSAVKWKGGQHRLASTGPQWAVEKRGIITDHL